MRIFTYGIEECNMGGVRKKFGEAKYIDVTEQYQDVIALCADVVVIAIDHIPAETLRTIKDYEQDAREYENRQYFYVSDEELQGWGKQSGTAWTRTFDNAGIRLRNICYGRLHEIFQDEVPQEYLDQLDWELHSLSESGADETLLLARELVRKSGLNPYEIGYRGCLGSLLTAYLCGITYVNPIESRWILYPEFAIGVDGNKYPEISLNFPMEAKNKLLDSYGALEGIGSIFYILTNDQVNMLHLLTNEIGINVERIPLDDLDVGAAIGGRGDVSVNGIPGMESEFIRTIAEKIHVEKFTDVVQLFCLAHGTGVWEENMEELIEQEGFAEDSILASREDVFECLLALGFSREDAFHITEFVRKGKARSGNEKWLQYKKRLLEADAPEWFVNACEKIWYMFPRAHAYIYALHIWWLAWFKLYFPLDFQRARIELLCTK